MKPWQVLVVYYSQSGQGRALAESLFLGAIASGEAEITFMPYRPVEDFPFPWPADRFFDVFPETIAGTTVPIVGQNPLQPGRYHLVVFVWQSWYLTLSIPVTSLLSDAGFMSSLGNTPVLTLTGSRNMWANAYGDLIHWFRKYTVNHIGNIVTADRHHNLISAFTIVRWLIRGQKEASKVFPEAGVSATDLAALSRHWPLLRQALETSDFNLLQGELVKQGAVRVLPAIVSIENKGRRVFGIWSRIIGRRQKNVRKLLLSIFKYYLYFAIFAISPVVEVLFWLIYPLRIQLIKRRITELKLLLGK